MQYVSPFLSGVGEKERLLCHFPPSSHLTDGAREGGCWSEPEDRIPLQVGEGDALARSAFFSSRYNYRPDRAQINVVDLCLDISYTLGSFPVISIQ